MTWYKEQLWVTCLVTLILLISVLMDIPGSSLNWLGPFWIIAMIAIQIWKKGKGRR